MQLFLQLNLSQLPKELGTRFGKGLLQFFFCTNSERECFISGYGDPFAKCQVVRVVDADSDAKSPKVPKIKGYFPAKQISGWKVRNDHPALQEHPNLGLTADDFMVCCPELGISEDDDVDLDYYEYIDWAGQHCFSGEKLAGWPAWKQNIEYSKCPKCDGLMDNMVFQFGSQDHVPYMFADGGCGQILQCPKHKKSVGFVWASG